jgi:3-oxoacyl-[acyl-carrier protein] reductase
MIIVTGSSRSIGNAVANRLTKNGHEVLGISRTIPEGDSSFKTYQADVTKRETLIELRDNLKENNITVKGLINCAGLLETVSMDWLDREESELESIFATNVIGTMNTCQIFVPLMNRKEHTPIINMASLAAHAVTDFAVYGASKSAVHGFTKGIAKKLKNTSIRPNCISPGPIFPSGMTDGVPEMAMKLFANPQIHSGKLHSPEDICDIVELLLDPRSKTLTGQAFHIGGY